MMENKGEIVIFESEDGLAKLNVNLKDDNVWLTMDQMADLYDKAKSTISEHIQDIFNDGELIEDIVMKKFGNSEFSKKPTNYYNLDMILAVGYRVRSKRGMQFRIWATNTLKEYIKKGFALDDDRLKSLGGGNYFKELLDRIRDIRSSEKVMYRQLLDLFATSIDYDKNSDLCIKYFKIVQNKFHFAAHGKTAAEVIYERADSSKDFMGLKTFTGEMPKLKDVVIAKNYLNEKELKKLNNLVAGYFDFAERKAEEKTPMKMEDYLKYLDNLLKAGDDKILVDNGKISHEEAIDKAKSEYKKYQSKTLSQVEMDYIESLKSIEKKLK